MSIVGQVVQATLPRRTPGGREQAGRRPCVVVGDFSTLGAMRFPMVLLVPLTSANAAREAWAGPYPSLYPRQQAGSGSGAISVESFALLDQLAAIDASRIMAIRGKLDRSEVQPILEGLRRVLGA